MPKRWACRRPTTVERFLAHRDNHAPTPLHALPALARELGVGAIHVKDEGFRLGLGSFKALGGAYAVIRLVLEEAQAQLGRRVDVAELARARGSGGRRRHDVRLRDRRQSRPLGGAGRAACRRESGDLRPCRRQRRARRGDRPLRRRDDPRRGQL